MVQKAMLKCKLKSAQRKNTDKKLINDLKQQLVQKEQEVRTLKVGIDPQSIEEIDRPTISDMIGEVAEDIKLLKQAAVAYNKKNRLKFLI